MTSIHSMKSESYLLGIDLGTMGVKSTIYSVSGKNMGSFYKEYPLDSPFPSWAQQDQNLWWKSTRWTIEQCLRSANIPSDSIAGIGVCGQSHGASPISKEGEPLYPCQTWVDRRSEPQINWIKKKIGDRRVFEINGFPLDAAYTASKIIWLRENEPEVFNGTYKFLLPKDYLVFRLTGEFSTDRTDAYATDLFDLRKKKWSSELLYAYNIDMDSLPTIHEPWDIEGEVTGNCAEETGLEKGTPVVAGGGDWACTFYGAGFTKPRRGVDMCGTVDGLVIGGEDFVIDYDKGLSSWTNIIPDLQVAANAGTQTAGNILRWCRDEFFSFEKQVGEKFGISPYKLMDVEAETVSAGSGGVIVTPHQNAQRSPKNVYSRGLIYGLTLTTKRAHIIRAIMEGIAYELRLDLEKFRSTTGKEIPCDEIRAIGGGAKSKLWRQIKADIIQIPFCKINIDEGGNFGTAVLAGFAVGLYNDLIKPIEEIVKVTEKELPTESNRKVYNEMFNLYCRINEVLEQSKYYETFAERAKELFPK